MALVNHVCLVGGPFSPAESRDEDSESTRTREGPVAFRSSDIRRPTR